MHVSQCSILTWTISSILKYTSKSSVLVEAERCRCLPWVISGIGQTSYLTSASLCSGVWPHPGWRHLWGGRTAAASERCWSSDRANGGCGYRVRYCIVINDSCLGPVSFRQFAVYLRLGTSLHGWCPKTCGNLLTPVKNTCPDLLSATLLTVQHTSCPILIRALIYFLPRFLLCNAHHVRSYLPLQILKIECSATPMMSLG